MGQAGDLHNEWSPYDNSECRGVYVPPGMTREMVVGTAKIISDFVEQYSGAHLNRYLAEALARDAIINLQQIGALP